MTIVACEPRSPAWWAARLGRLTSSRVAEAFAKIKSGGYSTSRRNLVIQLVLERLTGKSQENGYESAAMVRGREMEAEARGYYEAETGMLVESPGVVQHDGLMAGCSPDGLTEDGIIEIKCPIAATHLDYLRGGLPNEYLLQIIHTLWITGRTWGEFVSYHPDFPGWGRMTKTRIHAKDVDFNAHELNVRLFLDEVAKETEAVEGLCI